MIIIPEKVNYIINKLEANGFEAFAVGGCIRDSLLFKTPQDWDITTSAKPEELMNIFHKTIPTGLQHGTVTVVLEEESFEVTTYRTEGDYIDNRHPSEVIFVSSLEEDLSRRDFTINAMAYSENRGLKDPFKGSEDLKNHIIRCVGEPNKRFQEDALRMLRAIRFKCQLSFEIEQETLASIKLNHRLIKNISFERTRDELCKILLSETPSNGFILLKDTNILEIVLPELKQCLGFNQYNPHHDKDVFHHILEVVDYCPKDLILRLSALLHDISKLQCFSLDEKGIGHFYGHNVDSAEKAVEILKRLKFDNCTIDRVKILVKEHSMNLNEAKTSTIKKFISRVGMENIDRWVELKKADLKAHSHAMDYTDIFNVEEKIKNIINSKEPLSIKDLNISGKDIINLGVNPGKEIGIILNKLLELVLENPELNSKDKLIDYAERML